MIILRLLNKIFAKTFGYFWIPCPLCGGMFGGHEEHSNFSLMDGNMGKIVCKNCEQDARLHVHERTENAKRK